MYNSSSVFAVNNQARCMVSQRACSERHRFIVGTCSLHEANELSVLQFTEESNHIEAVSVYQHLDQVGTIETSPKNSAQLVTSRISNNGSKCITLWNMQNQSADEIENEISTDYNNDQNELTELCTFGHSQRPSYIDCLKWNNFDDSILSLDGKYMTLWKLNNGQFFQSDTIILEAGSSSSGLSKYGWVNGSASWDPHNMQQFTVGYGGSLQFYDAREMKLSQLRDGAHDGCVKDVDYNPNKPMTIISSGEDRKVKFWDTRNLRIPLKTLAGHTHWVCCSKYNPHHDQLVVSGGSDNLVNLWRIASISSAPWIAGEDLSPNYRQYEESNNMTEGAAPRGNGSELALKGSNETNVNVNGVDVDSGDANDPPDVKVRAMDQHEECVYSVAWSSAEAWIYASLSYDGRVIVNHVPSTEKYKILL